MKKANSVSALGNPSEDLANKYFFWLYDQIERRQERNDSRDLASLLHSIEFRPIVPNDDNRAGDGQALREDFYRQMEIPYGSHIDGPCTVLEMLIGLARRIDDILTNNPEQYRVQRWFWEMVENLGLKEYDEKRNREIIHLFITRKYSRDGKGGLFPLRKAPRDQRDVEIWYQLMAYVEERYPDW